MIRKPKAFTPEQGREFAVTSRSTFFKYSKAGKAYTRTFRDSPVMCFPNITSWDPKFLDLTTRVSQKLREANQVDIRDDGFFGTNAVSTNFMEINTVAGQLTKPIGYTLVNNEIIRNESNLSNGFVKDRHKKIFDEMMRCKYSDYDSDSLAKVSKISSSGFPLFSSEVEYKHQHLEILADNISTILSNFVKGDLESNFKMFGLIACSSQGLRKQYDAFINVNGKWISKPRLYNDIDFAFSGGSKGNREPADKSVYIDGILYPEKATTRNRGINVLPSAYNNIGSVVFEGFRSAAEEKYHMTYKHKGKENVKSKIDRYPVAIGLDVTQYDNSFPEWLFEEWIESFQITDEFKEFCRLGMKSPSFYSSDGPKSDPVWTGDPLDKYYYSQFGGLPSGIFFTSMLGKDGFTWATLCMIDDIMSDVLGNVDSILKHEHAKYAISNMGDDTIIHSCDNVLIERLKHRSEVNAFGMSEYFKVDIEDGFRFLGMVGYKDKAEKINLVGDLATYFGNMLVPERSLGSKMREFGVYGILERRKVYNDNPSFDICDEIFQKEFLDIFKHNWIDLLSDNLVLPSTKDIIVRSPEDLEVLMDSSKLFYKYDADMISTEIVESFQTTVKQSVSDKIRAVALKGIK